MKKIIILIFLCVLINSCNTPHYVIEDNNSRIGVNLKEGKWLLNEVDTSPEYKQECENLILTNLKSKIGNRVSYILTTNDIIFPKKIPIAPSKIILKDIKKGTNFDYLINVKTEVLKNTLQNIDITHHNYNKGLSRSVSVIFEVYDLNLTEIVYSKKIIGTSRISESNNSDINFTTSIKKNILGGIKKVLKKVK